MIFYILIHILKIFSNNNIIGYKPSNRTILEELLHKLENAVAPTKQNAGVEVL